MMGGEPASPLEAALGPLRALLRGEELASLEEEDEEDARAAHPCAREMGACIREGQSRASSSPFPAESREAIEQCLLAHLEQLSPACHCFVRQMVPQRAAAPPRPLMPSPTLARLAPPAARHGPPGEVAYAEAPLHPLHKLSCVLFFVALFLFAYLLMRVLLAAACTPKSKRVVLIPNEAASVVQIAEPLHLPAGEAKATGAVQVAQPL